MTLIHNKFQTTRYVIKYFLAKTPTLWLWSQLSNDRKNNHHHLRNFEVDGPSAATKLITCRIHTYKLWSERGKKPIKLKENFYIDIRRPQSRSTVTLRLRTGIWSKSRPTTRKYDGNNMRP